MSKNINHAKNNSRNFPKNQTSNKLLLLPLIIIIAFIPLIVRMKVYNTGLAGYSWFSATDTQTDFFLSFKSIAFTFVSFVIAFILIWNLINYRILNNKSTSIFKEDGKYKITYALFPLTLYAILALLSTVFSKYSTFGYSGIFEQFESIFVLLGYCLVVYYAFLVVKTEDDVKLLLKWLLISVLILCLLGLTQATGNDFYSSSFGKKLIVPSSYWHLLDQLEFTFEKNRVYLTLYNPNYVGLYTALVSPILLVLLLFTKNLKLQILYIISILGLILCMVASSSRNGFVALCVSFLFIIILFRKLFIKHWKISLGVFGLIVVVFFAINTFMGNTFISRLESMFTVTTTPEYTLSSIETNDDNITIIYNNNKIYIQAIPKEGSITNFILMDENKSPINTKLDEATNTYYIDDPRFSAIQLQQIKLETVGGFNVIIDGTNWYFSNETGDNTYYYSTAYGKFEKILNADSAIFTNYEKIGSGRGYIWSRTIPLLKKRIFLGSGADTFAIVYPQNDYIGRYNNGYISSLITKPHNMFLQMAVQTGLLSAISFLTFYAMYFASCIKLYLRNEFETFLSQSGAAIFIGTIGYMVSSIFNDSTVTVSPIFWSLLGIGLAINYNIKKIAK